MSTFTQPVEHTAAEARSRSKLGATLIVLVAGFLLFDAVIHTANIALVEEAMVDLGYPSWTATFIGVLELVGVALYVVPRTRIVGAVYLTAYLGGAFASQLRIEAPTFSTLLFPVYLGVAMWAGVVLRNPDVRRFVTARER